MSKTSKPAAGKTPTTEKIAFQTGAAKDERYASAINEDQASVMLDVLANDPGSAKLYSLAQGITSSSSQVEVLNTVTLNSGAVVALDNGVVRYDISGANHQALALGEIAVESFDYVIRMGNGALSTATATVEIVGLNDAPVLAALPADPILILDSSGPEPARIVGGRLEGRDVDNGAVLTYGFVETATQNEDGTVSIATPYGRIVLDANTGEYSFAVDAQALDELSAADEVLIGFDVRVHDEHGAGSNIETIQFMLKGTDEAPDVSVPQFGEVTTFVVNHGLDFVNGRSVLYGFDGNDKLKLAAVQKVGDIYHVDTDEDGIADSSALMVQFSQGNGAGNGNGGKGNGNGNHSEGVELAEIVLSGYLGLSDNQIVSSGN